MDLTPDKTQIDQAAIAHEEFASLIDRLIREGFDYRSLTSGAAAALAQSITASAGAGKASEWFYAMGAQAESFSNPKAGH